MVWKGTLRLERDATCWEDIRLLAGAFQFAGVADPTLSDWQPTGAGTTFKVFKFQKDDEVYASIQLPHNYRLGSDLLFHLHWTPCDRGAVEDGNYVGWKVDYSIAIVDGTFPVSATADLSHACSGVDAAHELTASVAVNGAGITELSAMIMLKIYRSDTGADDTWVGATAALSPALLEFDVHYEVDSLGSREELLK